MKFKLRNVETGEIVQWNLAEILKEINRDRSDEWVDYDEADWQEGLEVFTEYELLQDKRDFKRPPYITDCGSIFVQIIDNAIKSGQN